MHPPDPESDRGRLGKGGPRSQTWKIKKHQRTYSIPADVQALLIALAPLLFPLFFAASVAWGLR
jgi:hypothetical protein